MKYLRFLLVGVVFGVIMTKSEVISWYRIYEMFKFDSFHMYGVIGSAVITGILIVQFIKRRAVNSINSQPISFTPKNPSVARYLAGGIIFGLGWAMTGACPGPMFVLVGHGIGVMVVVIASAVLGTFAYGLIRNQLPH